MENDLAASPHSLPEIYPESKGCKIYDKQLEIVENEPVTQYKRAAAPFLIIFQEF